MKKRILLVLSCLPAIGFAQSNTFAINVKVGDVGAPAKAYIHYTTNQKAITDSVPVMNGRFQFSGTITDIVKAQIFINHKGSGLPKPHEQNNDILSFYLEAGAINIAGKDSIKHGIISGSKINSEYEAYNALLVKPMRHIVELNNTFMTASESKKKDTAFVNMLQRSIDNTEDEKLALESSYVKKNPDSYFSLSALLDLAGPEHDVKKIAPFYKDLSSRVRGTSLGRSIGGLIEKGGMISIGATAPEFTQNDVNGKPVKLSQFRGKYVLIDFWASWCAPCRAENPNVVKAYARYKNKNFTIIGVSLDRPGKKDDWIAAIKKDGLTWTQVSDLQYGNNAVALLYGVNAIPQNFLIDPSGKIIAKDLRGEDLNSKLASIFPGQTDK